jgi:hypothetical protein
VPAVATITSILGAITPSAWQVIAVQRTQPLLWIIDTAPIFRGCSLLGGTLETRHKANAQNELALTKEQEDEAQTHRAYHAVNAGADAAATLRPF